MGAHAGQLRFTTAGGGEIVELTEGVASIVGIVILEQAEHVADAREFNSAVMADADGNVVGRYDKRYLLAFGEYLPFGETFPKIYDYSPNSGRLSSGSLNAL